MRQDAALQILAQLSLDVLRQGTLVFLAGFSEERLEMLGDDLVERRGLGLVPLVALGLGDSLPLMRWVRTHSAKSASSVPSGECR